MLGRDVDGVVDIMKSYTDQQKGEVDDRILLLEKTNRDQQEALDKQQETLDKQAAAILVLEQRINNLTGHVNAGYDIIFPELHTIKMNQNLFSCDDLEEAFKVLDCPNTP